MDSGPLRLTQDDNMSKSLTSLYLWSPVSRRGHILVPERLGHEPMNAVMIETKGDFLFWPQSLLLSLTVLKWFHKIKT